MTDYYKTVVLIDDIRDIPADVVLRNVNAARMYLFEWAIDYPIDTLLLDHDLGHLEDNGYKILTSLLDSGNHPRVVRIVSSNPVGRDNCGRALVDAGYKKKDPSLFIKEALDYRKDYEPMSNE